LFVAVIKLPLQKLMTDLINIDIVSNIDTFNFIYDNNIILKRFNLRQDEIKEK